MTSNVSEEELVNTLRKRISCLELSLSHWKNHADDLGEQLSISSLFSKQKGLYDVFAEKSLQALIETLAIENATLKEKLDEKLNLKNSADILKKNEYLEGRIEQLNSELKHQLEKCRQLRQDLDNKSDDKTMKQDLQDKFDLVRQENAKLKTCLMLNQRPNDILRNSFKSIENDLYVIFKNLATKYGTRLEDELEKRDELALPGFLKSLLTDESETIVHHLKPTFSPKISSKTAATDTQDSGYGTQSETESKLNSELFKLNKEYENLKITIKEKNEEIENIKAEHESSIKDILAGYEKSQVYASDSPEFESCESTYESESKQRHEHSLKKQIENLNDQLHVYALKVKQLEINNEEKYKQIQILQTEVKQFENKNKENDKQIQILQTEVKQSENSNKEKGKHIRILEDDIKSCQSEIQWLNEEINKHESSNTLDIVAQESKVHPKESSLKDITDIKMSDIKSFDSAYETTTQSKSDEHLEFSLVKEICNLRHILHYFDYKLSTLKFDNDDKREDIEILEFLQMFISQFQSSKRDLRDILRKWRPFEFPVQNLCMKLEMMMCERNRYLRCEIFDLKPTFDKRFIEKKQKLKSEVETYRSEIKELKDKLTKLTDELFISKQKQSKVHPKESSLKDITDIKLSDFESFDSAYGTTTQSKSKEDLQFSLLKENINLRHTLRVFEFMLKKLDNNDKREDIEILKDLQRFISQLQSSKRYLHDILRKLRDMSRSATSYGGAYKTYQWQFDRIWMRWDMRMLESDHHLRYQNFDLDYTSDKAFREKKQKLKSEVETYQSKIKEFADAVTETTDDFFFLNQKSSRLFNSSLH